MKTYDEILRELKHGNYAPAYFLYGEEPYYIDRLTEYIESEVLDPMAREFDQMVVYGKDLPEDSIASVISAAKRFPMMGSRQVIIVKEAQSIKKWEALSYYMEKPMPTTLLVICYKYGKPDKRLSVFKNFEKSGGVMMESQKLRDYQVQEWIMRYVSEWSKNKGLELTITFPAVALIADSLGTDLDRIVSELDKLILASPEGTKVITPELVERNIGISKDYNIFELENALIADDRLKANRIVNYFADSKAHPIQKELIVLFSFFVNLLLYHYLEDKSDMAVSSMLGINRFFVKDYRRAAQRYSAKKTFRIIGYIRETDARSKGIDNPSTTEGELWKELIYKILH